MRAGVAWPSRGSAILFRSTACWAKARPQRFEAQANAGLSPLVGRDEELAGLRRMWRSALAGEGGAVLVGGEPGIGKSRLARAFIEQVRREQNLVLQWHCAAHLANRPMHPIVRELERTSGMSRGMPAAERLQALASYVAQVPGLGDEGFAWLADLLRLEVPDRPALDAPTRARFVNEALLRRIDSLSAAMPTLILIEDAHWADAATLELVTALVPRLADSRIMLLVTHRPEFEPPWPASDRVRSIALAGIDMQAGDRLLGMVAQGRTLPPAVAKMILEKAGGVPLFVEDWPRRCSTRSATGRWSCKERGRSRSPPPCRTR